MAMSNKKDMDAFVAKMAAGRASAGKSMDPRAQTVNHLNTKPAKTPRTATQATPGISSNAPPNPTRPGKTKGKAVAVLQPQTAIAKPSKAKAKPGAGQAFGAHVTVNHYYGSTQPTGTDEGEY